MALLQVGMGNGEVGCWNCVFRQGGSCRITLAFFLFCFRVGGKYHLIWSFHQKGRDHQNHVLGPGHRWRNPNLFSSPKHTATALLATPRHFQFIVNCCSCFGSYMKPMLCNICIQLLFWHAANIFSNYSVNRWGK